MPAAKAQALHDLNDFADFLRALEENSFDFAIIGGCAVGAYASLQNQPLVSADLDIIVSDDVLPDLLAWAPRQGITVRKRPSPRSVPVAVFDWEGKEVNALTATTGLPDSDTVIRTAREFALSQADDLIVPIADPFDLLANKLAIRRDKDLPHIEILRRFIEEEVVAAFREEEGRKRLVPARRMLRVLGRTTLPKSLAKRLIAEARSSVDYRFLMGRVPESLAKEVLNGAPDDAALRNDLLSIMEGRRMNDASGE